jgi:hypothetical protein
MALASILYSYPMTLSCLSVGDDQYARVWSK